MNFRTLHVIEKATGKPIVIKDFRFNPALHAYINNGNEEGIDLSTVIAEAAKAPVVEVPAEPVEDVEPTVVPAGDVSTMKFGELKAYAKSKGVSFSNTTKKSELLELLKNAEL